MKGFPLHTRPAPNLLPYVLLAGLILGIAISKNMIRSPVSPARQIPTETLTDSSSPVMSLTVAVNQSVAITPLVNIPTIAQMGKPAPDFALKTIAGKEIELSDFRGKAVLINIWASWCPP